jgi:phosphoribosylamine--glycine ligase
MNILVITNSARGEAIVDALHRSHHHPQIFALSTVRSPGLLRMCQEVIVGDILDFATVKAYAKKIAPDFAFIAPDDPIGEGLADALFSIGIRSIGPTKSLARIESDKGFARQLFEKYGIDASPKFRVFEKESDEEIRLFLESDLAGEYVVKYAGLKGGKGVKVGGEHLHSLDEAVEYARACITEGGSVVIEEKLIGVEFSLLSFVAGESVVDMPAVQDHKRAFNGDTGPNTGGMGTYSDVNHSLPFLREEDLQRASELNKKVADALQEECGERYCGILYGGFIATKDGVKIIEYNARFGDPEALNILPLLETDFVDLCLDMINGVLQKEDVSFAKKATVCLYITPKSYPDAKNERGQEVIIPTDIPENIQVFYGDVSLNEDQKILLGGSRSIGVVALANSLSEAQKSALSFCEKIQGPIRYRTDIGTEALIEERVEMMRGLRIELVAVGN